MTIAFLGYGEIGATVLQPLAAHHEVAVAISHRQDFAGGTCSPPPTDRAQFR